MYKNKIVLITGGSGFLGKAMTRFLTDHCIVHSLSSQDVDLRNRNETIDCFASIQPDIVIHCAVQGGGIGWMKDHPVDSGQDNIYINTHSLEASFLCGADSFIGVSSACIYPKQAELPYNEDQIWDGYPEPLNGPYALSKRLMMDLGRAYATQHQFHCSFPILANLYGEGDHISPDKAHVIADLMIRCSQDPEQLIVWGTGVAQREFIHVDDAIQGILACLNGDPGSFFNIGSGEATSILDLAHLILDAHGLHCPIVLDRSKPDGQLQKRMSVEKAKKELGWSSQISLKEGLFRTAKWYRENRI